MGTQTDGRPPFAVGHALLPVSDVATSAAYFERVGLRPVAQDEAVAIFELRGGTHLILLPTDTAIEAGTHAPFDLMTDDIPAMHAHLSGLGLNPTAIERADFHERFTITEPSGYAITVNSSHVEAGHIV